MRKTTLILCILLLPFLTVPLLADDSLYQSPSGKTGYDRFTIPLIDLAEHPEMQVLVDKEDGQYLGHVTTVLLDDGKTILCVYPKGHGSGAIVYKKSFDGGKTWSDRLPTPENWKTSMEVPTLYRTVDAAGKKRVLMFSGAQTKFMKDGPVPIRMAVSEDEGETWSELKPIGDYAGVVAMSDVVPLKTGPGHYMALYHLGKSGTFYLYKVLSTDGGVTWSEPETICSGSDAGLCEPGAIRSPDGKQIAVLLRENRRKYNSQIIFSDDEGKTWTEPRPLPASLCGDRHTLRYTKDGRIFASFRDYPPKTMKSPTSGDWVGWVGTYQDLVDGKEGQYRVRLMKNTKGFDTTYPGVVVLPDDTIVATTYGHWEKGKSPYIMTVRFKLADLDQMYNKGFSEGVAHQTLFQKGKENDGYNNIRIPAICATKNGTLLAFAEGRVAGDTGKIELILRRSEDHGKTWSPIQIVWSDGENTCGNPTPVCDQDTGTVWLLTTWNDGRDHENQIMEKTSRFPRIPYVLKSEDDGKTWSQAKPLPHLRKENWGWYATGPCNAIQLTRGPHKGRLVIPANHSIYRDGSEADKAQPWLYRSHIIFSDDHGETWHLGGIQKPYTNESTVVELEDGSVMQNMRSYHGRGSRAVAISRDGGANFSNFHLDTLLQTPVCQANILRYSWAESNKPGVILFASPSGAKRSLLTLWLSRDDAKTWTNRKLAFAGPAAYSNLVSLPDNRVGLLAEIGEKGPYEKIAFLSFSLDWISPVMPGGI